MKFGHQLTLTEWTALKGQLQAELIGIKKSFVKVGYLLRKVDETEGYRNDGYNSVTEWAKGEYGLEGSTVSRFMAINREYSIDGFSEELLPQYEDFKRSQLEEMLKLPEEDRAMITPDTPRADIRELKNFNKTAPEETETGGHKELVKSFFENNLPILREIYSEAREEKAMIEIVKPEPVKSYRKGIYFMSMNDNEILIKAFGKTPEKVTWQRFFEITKEVFGEELEEKYMEHEKEEREENAGESVSQRDDGVEDNVTETGNRAPEGTAETIERTEQPTEEDGEETAEETVEQKEEKEAFAPAQKTAPAQQTTVPEAHGEAEKEQKMNQIFYLVNTLKIPINKRDWGKALEKIDELRQHIVEIAEEKA